MIQKRAMFFWLSGVFTPPRFTVLTKAVLEAGGSYNNLITFNGLQALDEQLTLGLIDDLEFIKILSEVIQLRIEPEIIKEKILAVITPNRRIRELIHTIPQNFQKWLIVDYPVSWFNQISEKLNVHLSFPLEKMIFLPKLGLKNISPDLFSFLPTHCDVPLDRCLLINGNSKHVLQAINYGFPTIIFVDTQRLERELRLQNIIHIQ